MDAAQLAIGLTGTVLKLIHFSFEFIGDVKQVRKQGATARNVDLSTIAKNVAIVTTRLEAQLEAMGGNDSDGAHALDPLEAQLKSLSQRATEIGRELDLKLQRVTTDKKSPWKSFKVVALGMWDAGGIGKIEKRLNAINNEIQSGVLVDLRTSFNQFHDENTSRILDTLEEFAKLLAQSRHDSTNIIEQLNSADGIGKARHEELLNAIYAMSVTSSPSYTPIPPALPGLPNESVRQAAEEAILNCLWYPRIREREETIFKAHANTFHWIFEDPKVTGKPWDSFVDFLRGDRSIYWITGKPGSGKSTLMKFVIINPRTQDLLQTWAGEKDLIRASFYFFYGGDQNQKSEPGLCRSLLFNSEAEARHDDHSLQEAKKALKDLIIHNPNINFFFSIDGLDEFDPKVSATKIQSLIALTHFLGECKNVKILVSSHPLLEFESGYVDSDSLRIHDLTKEDIRRYAHEKLASHLRIKTLEKQSPSIMDELLQPIVESSLGVFLWVRVVVESLIEGLTNCDSVNDLKKSLQGLPSDLQDLYMTILERVDPSYKPQAARLLSFEFYDLGSGPGKYSLLDLWFAENADDDLVRQTPIQPIRDEELRKMFQELETQIKTRCLGLLEIVHNTPCNEKDDRYYLRMTKSRYASTRLLHRSVYEFLRCTEVWDKVVAKHLSCAFSVTLSLFRSSILMIKTYQPSPRARWTDITNLAAQAGRLAALAERDTKKSHCDLVHELDVAMHGIMPLVHALASTGEPRDFSLTYFPDRICHWSAWCRLAMKTAGDHTSAILWPLHDTGRGSLITFAAEYGLTYYIQSLVAEKGCKVLQKEGLPLLGYALVPFDFGTNYLNPETIQFLLSKGSDPNELYNGTSIWEWFLWTGGFDRDTTIPGKRGDRVCLETLRVTEALLLSGAEPDGRLISPTWACITRIPVSGEWEASDRPWYPNYRVRTDADVRTLLSALVREKQCSDVIGQKIKELIAFLEARGATQNEWASADAIEQVLSEVYQRMSDKQCPFAFVDFKTAFRKRNERFGIMSLGTTTSDASTISEVSVDSASSVGTHPSRWKH
ncbi:hypothetical protein GGR55DRAFT_681332 [Xylaria sp. FL0064]|nr:hypothetical protein GGR55DRAFT_681332 [Xylaria sp. FL0064]